MIDLTHPCLTLPLISVTGVITSLAGVAVIEGIMKREETDEKVHFLATGKGLFTLLSVVFGLWLLPLVLLFWEAPKGAGEAGDMFGSVTALFSGLAFAGLIAALFTQRQELITQRKELALQRKELELSRREYKLQRFENTLFAMIELFNGHVQSLERLPKGADNSTQPNKGRDVLVNYADELGNQIYTEPDYSTSFGYRRARRSLDEVLSKYDKAYIERFEQDVSPYFRLLYNTFRPIEGAELAFNDEGLFDASANEELQQKYAKIVRAYFSTAEIRLLMFNCASQLGSDFLPWVKKYQLLKHLRREDASLNPDLVYAHGAEAFGERWPEIERAAEEYSKVE